MSDLGPLSGEERKLDPADARAAVDPGCLETHLTEERSELFSQSRPASSAYQWGTDMKRREFIRALGGAATATIGAFGIRLEQLIGYDRLRSQPA